MDLLLVVVVVVVLLGMWVTWTATRIDRLHARSEAARSSLDAQLVRRAAAARALADDPQAGLDTAAAARLRAASTASLDPSAVDHREAVENELSRAISVASGVRAAELDEACDRVTLARRFYNDAVRDTRSLRGQRLPRLLRLGGRRPLPAYFEIDDGARPAGGSSGRSAVP